MRRPHPTRWLLPLIMLLAACSGGPAAPDRRITVEADAVLLTIGDSITTGHPQPSDQAWPSILARETGLDVVNRARNGATSTDVLAGLDTLLREYQPTLVIATVGGNDFLRRQSLADAELNIRDIAREVTASGAQFLLLGLAEWQRSEVHPIYPRALEGLSGVHLDATILPHVYSKRSLRADPVHPNAEGHRLIAERVMQWIDD